MFQRIPDLVGLCMALLKLSYQLLKHGLLHTGWNPTIKLCEWPNNVVLCELFIQCVVIFTHYLFINFPSEFCCLYFIAHTSFELCFFPISSVVFQRVPFVYSSTSLSNFSSLICLIACVHLTNLAHQVDCSLIPLDLSNVFIWQRAH